VKIEGTLVLLYNKKKNRAAIPMFKECLNCGGQIKVKPSHFERKKFCSRNCKTLYQKKNPPDF
jgi:hypothetical protein